LIGVASGEMPAKDFFGCFKINRTLLTIRH
jgi:hypothetical protein